MANCMGVNTGSMPYMKNFTLKEIYKQRAVIRGYMVLSKVDVYQ